MSGGHWPPGAVATAVGRFVSWARALCWGGIFLGERAYASLGVETPTFIKSVSESKMQAALMVFWISNIIAANAMNTGAFEVFYDGEPVTSKLASGTLPRIDVVFQAIRQIRKQ